MPPKHQLITLLAACFVSSCTIGPDYIKPAIPAKKQFDGQSEVAQRAAEADSSLATWWQSYNDPQLTRFVSLALQQNLQLAEANARIEQAKARLGLAHAALLPSGNIAGQAARAYQSVETPLGQVLNSTPNYDRYGNSYEANLGIGWELDLFGSLRHEKAAAFADYEAAEASTAATSLAVAAQTADVYINIRGLQARLDIAHRQLKTHQALLSNLQLLFGKGLIAELEVYQAESALAQAKAAVAALQSGLVQAMNALDVMLGTQPGTHRQELSVTTPLPTVPAIKNMGTPGDLLQRRPDLIVAERRLASSNAQIGQAMAEFYPKFSLNGLIGSVSTDSASQLFGNGSSQASSALGLRWRLFDFGRINAQIDQAKGLEAELLAAYRLATLRATAEVENAFTELLQLEQQAEVLGQGENALNSARAASSAAYQRGVVSQIEVLRSDEQWLRMSDARLQAQIAAVRASISTFKALGGGWDSNTGRTSS